MTLPEDGPKYGPKHVDITLSRTSKSFSEVPIVYRDVVVCVHTRVSDSYKKKGICVYFVLENSRQFKPVKHYYLSPHLCHTPLQSRKFVFLQVHILLFHFMALLHQLFEQNRLLSGSVGI
jgi:hypothetical protein